MGPILALPDPDLVSGSINPNKQTYVFHIFKQDQLFFKKVYFRQLMLKDFGNLGVMKLTPPVSIKDLAMLGEC